MPVDLDLMSPEEILRLHRRIINELKKRGITRTNNSPLGDYAEWLAAKTLNLKLGNSSQAGFDAIDDNSVRYQIKARICKYIQRKIPLSAIRKLEGHSFDYLIAIFFDEEYKVLKCLKIPWQLVKDMTLNSFYGHANSHNLSIYPLQLAEHPEVVDLTSLFLKD